MVRGRDGDVLGLAAEEGVTVVEDALVGVTSATRSDGLNDLSSRLVAGVSDALVGGRNWDRSGDAALESVALPCEALVSLVSSAGNIADNSVVNLSS